MEDLVVIVMLILDIVKNVSVQIGFLKEMKFAIIITQKNLSITIIENIEKYFINSCKFMKLNHILYMII